MTSVLTSPRTRNLRRGLAERRRRLSRQPHRVFYFHQLDDPYSHLAAQVLAPFIERYEVELVPMLVGPPPAAAAPERERLVVFSREDAAGIAPDYGLEFRDPGEQPGSALLSLAGRILAGALDGAAFASLAVRVGRALWSGDAKALEALAREHPHADESSAQSAIAAGDEHRRRLGHYLGGTFFYGGEWYWGIDRLHYLERRLADLGVRRAGMPNALVVAREERSTGEPASTGPALTLEFFVSLRSPYTAIAFSHVYDLVRRSGVKLVLRPVLPMVMRGLPVPRVKRLYIVLDTKREAERAGVAFGRVCDPVGRPVERAYSLYPWAREQGRAEEYLHGFARAAFAEGIDVGTDAGLEGVVERAGLLWDEALEHLDSQSWRDEIEANRQALLEMGLWGVPSFRLSGPAGAPDFCTWGQDRLWRIEQEIRRRLG
ncbi:MAG: DsbA family protein [Deltaproteobacteria bacterium]|nr:DsbA family protein [Deltaproteobacteria bacterium]